MNAETIGGVTVIKDRFDAHLPVTAERVPDRDRVTDDEWDRWCSLQGFRNLGREGRGAWIDGLSTYLRDAEYLVFRHEQLIDICHGSELAWGLERSEDDAGGTTGAGGESSQDSASAGSPPVPAPDPERGPDFIEHVLRDALGAPTMVCSGCGKEAVFNPNRPQSDLGDSVFVHAEALVICGECAIGRVISSLAREGRLTFVGTGIEPDGATYPAT